MEINSRRHCQNKCARNPSKSKWRLLQKQAELELRLRPLDLFEECPKITIQIGPNLTKKLGYETFLL